MSPDDSSKKKAAKPAAGGIKAAAEILNSLDPPSRKRLLANLADRDPKLTSEIERQMFTFESLIRLSAPDIQAVLREVPHDKLALALKTATPALSKFIFDHLSKRNAQVLQEEIAQLGPRRLSEVILAQADIVEIAKEITHWSGR